ncbi:MAG: enoyl-CoA hydratase/isomerase family protein [Gemmatimonadetes bacterium]|nr:enoyl-CoA hydratase/isomerase family protein [Gemmatimonadota bacterium]NNK62869.1 enoyl-CoA hydratase/isomerase family protein [Gemmatimonadota bacterium]
MSEKVLVRYQVQDKVAILTLDDAPANTYTYEMFKQFDTAVLKARMDNDVEVIMITGAGDKFFSAGADISMLNEADPTFKYYFCLHANETLNRLEHTPKLTIAALNGHTVGGGLEIAMAADLRIARKGGGKMGLPEVNLGVLPGTGGTQRLCRIVGKSHAIEIMIDGALFDFDEGMDKNLVNQVIEAESSDDFKAQALEYAKQFTTPHKASKAVGNIKRSVQTGIGLPFEQALTVERELQQQLFQSKDAKEGISAYVEKRKAEFSGS